MYSDLLFLVIIFLFASLGFAQGFLFQFISLMSLLIVCLFSLPLAEVLKSNWLTDWPLFVVWMALTISVLVVGGFIRYAMMRFGKMPILNPIDRWMGFGLGALKGFLIVVLLTACLNLLPDHLRYKFQDADNDWQDSKMVSAGLKIMDWTWIPGIKFLDELRKDLNAPDTPFEKDSPWLREFGVESE